ncbi:hypothetical protein TGRUB_243780 [Toxoplasma gondii RUB]|uniref:Cyclin, N-terminal domain-containing protein n=1 Tax=Toxoplasma gondii RUB TaxID=935652 RepID=A0A086LUE8_TOXGO|nr:hypothetical protein TGRUB_243780 [Toxoplasma gondii RUB]
MATSGAAIPAALPSARFQADGHSAPRENLLPDYSLSSTSSVSNPASGPSQDASLRNSPSRGSSTLSGDLCPASPHSRPVLETSAVSRAPDSSNSRDNFFCQRHAASPFCSGECPEIRGQPRSLEARRAAAAIFARKRAAALAGLGARSSPKRTRQNESHSTENTFHPGPPGSECTSATERATEDNGDGCGGRETDDFSHAGETRFSGLLSRIADDATSALRAREEALTASRENGESGILGGFRYRLTRRIVEGKADRMLLIGTSNYLIVLGKSLGLSLRCISIGCVYLHLFFDSFFFSGLERKCAAAACLLLSWKYAEDSEESRCTRKLYDLARGMYRVSLQQKVADLRQVRERLLLALEKGRETEERREEGIECADSPMDVASDEQSDLPEVSDPSHAAAKPVALAGLSEPESAVKTLLSEEALADLASSSRWLLRDSAVSFRILCHKLRIYESALLRAIRFSVGPLHLPAAAIRFYVKAFLTKCERETPAVVPASPQAAACSVPSPCLRLSPAETPSLPRLSPKEEEEKPCSEERHKTEETSPTPSDAAVLDEGKPVSSPVSCLCTCKAWPARGLRHAQLQRRLHKAALQEFLLLCRTPFVLERQSNAIAAACVIRAAILSGLAVGDLCTPAPEKSRDNCEGPSASSPEIHNSRFEVEEGRKTEECILEALTAFSGHVDAFLHLVSNPLDEQKNGNAAERETTARCEDGVFAEEAKEREAFHGASSSSPAHGEMKEQSPKKPRTGAGLYGVNRREVQAVLSDLRQAAEWQLDLLHGPSPTFACPVAVTSQEKESPEARNGTTLQEAKRLRQDQAEKCRMKTEAAGTKNARSKERRDRKAENGI